MISRMAIQTYQGLLVGVLVLPESLHGGRVVHQLVCPLLAEPHWALKQILEA